MTRERKEELDLNESTMNLKRKKCKRTCVSVSADALVIVEQVDARLSFVLARIRRALVDVDVTALSLPPRLARAVEPVDTILTGAVQAGL